MVQELLPLLPMEPGRAALICASLGSLVGAGLWLAGARFSRSMLTLLSVAVGTAIGMRLPAWCGWTIDPMGPGVGGAVVLGVGAYVCHRLWVGVSLGLVLACWAAIAVWLLTGGYASNWAWPAMGSMQFLPQYLRDLWLSLPQAVSRLLPYACGAAMLSGVAAAALWPRVGGVLLWSVAGVTLLAGMGVTVVRTVSPASLRLVPAQTWVQAATLAGLVLFGALVQWQAIARRPAYKPAKPNPGGAS